MVSHQSLMTAGGRDVTLDLKFENVWQGKDLQARFLDVWQGKDLRARIADVWQGKELAPLRLRSG